MADHILDNEADAVRAQVECVRMHRALMKLAQGLGNPALQWSSNTSNIYEAIVDYALNRIEVLEKTLGDM